MKGFRNSTKMVSGHNFARGGHSIQAAFPSPRPAPSRGVGPGNPMGGLTDRGDPGKEGHSAVHREIPSNEMQAEHGGKGPLTPGYKKGGGSKHFHVHKHYHVGGKVVKSTLQSYSGDGGSMQKSKKFTAARSAGGFGQGKTGGTQPKLAKGGMHINPAHKGKFTKKMTGSKHGHLSSSDVQRGLHSKSGETRKEANFARMARRGFKPLHKAAGGHIIDSTHEIAPDYETGGTINRVATGGTINKVAAGGALYKKGGHSKEMSHHLNAPAPRGHKGLGAMIRRGR